MFVTGVGPRENKNFGATHRYKLVSSIDRSTNPVVGLITCYHFFSWGVTTSLGSYLVFYHDRGRARMSKPKHSPSHIHRVTVPGVTIRDDRNIDRGSYTPNMVNHLTIAHQT